MTKARSTGELTGHELRARARARAAQHESEYAAQRPTVAPDKLPSDPIVWDAGEYVAATVTAGKRIVSYGSKQGDDARARAAKPDAVARARAQADDRAADASKARRARLARYVRGGSFAPVHDDGRGLARFGLSLPFVRQGDERARYIALWLLADASKLDLAAARAARSVRRGRVSDTSREEAKAAARASLVASAVALAPIHLSAAIDRVCRPASDAMPDAVAAARASLRGDALGGVTARNGQVSGRAVSNDDGNGGLVWDIERGDWIKVTRADGATAYDLAGRIVCQERGAIDDDDAARTWARDAVRLVGWLVRLRLVRMAGERGQAVAPCVRARIRSAAAKVARVLRALARGESLAMAVRSVGWVWSEATGECQAWRKAIGALTDGRGLAAAMRDFRGGDVAPLPVADPIELPATVERSTDQPMPLRADWRALKPLANGQAIRLIDYGTRRAWRALQVAKRRLA